MTFVSFEDLHDLDAPGPESEPETVTLYEEKCTKCGGSGSYGRVTQLGHSKCTKCKGTGMLTFKTPLAVRQRARKAAKGSKARKALRNLEAFQQANPVVYEWLVNNPGDSFAISLLANIGKYGSLTDKQIGVVFGFIAREDEQAEARIAFKKENPEELQWLEQNAEGNTFAADLLRSFKRYGSLTIGQLAAVSRNVEREKAQDVKLAGKGTDIDLSNLPKGTYAVPGGDTRLKVRIRRPGKNSRWHGYIFVDDGAAYGNQRNYGRQAPGELYRGDIRDELLAILKDPYEAATAYGRLTGSCCVCGRLLEDQASIDAGIGPVCASKF